MGLICSGRKFDDNGKIIGYTLVNECGEILRVSSTELRESMINMSLNVSKKKVLRNGLLLVLNILK